MELRRDENNPILERDTIAGYDTLFNPGVCDVGDEIYLIARAARDNRRLAYNNGHHGIYMDQICDHLIFISQDGGKTFAYTGRKMTGSSSTWIDGYTKELCIPSYFGPFGTEDLRLCRIGDQYVGVVHVMTHAPYTGDHKAGGRVGLVITKDFQHYKRILIGPLREECDRDAWVMEHEGGIAYINRLKPDAAGRRNIADPSIQVTFFKDLDELISASPSFWQDMMDHVDRYTILSPTFQWEGRQIGGGPVLPHKEGYIFFYHGCGGAYYTGAALLDSKTLRCIRRYPDPILSPTEWYEKGEFGGDNRNITFVNGARYFNDNGIEIYYGAADSHIARAFVDDVDAFVRDMPVFDPKQC